jgi:protein CMS1
VVRHCNTSRPKPKLTVVPGILKLDKLERLVVDASHIDQKKRGIMDMKETMIPLARWLSRTEFKVKYSDPEQPLQLLFY